MNENIVKDIRIADYNYQLPDERIAKHPLQQRDSCKLLVRYPDGKIEQHIFSELSDIIPDKSILVYNNTRVINARLRFKKNGNGSTIEIFCLEPLNPWEHQENFCRHTPMLLVMFCREFQTVERRRFVDVFDYKRKACHT